MSKGVERLRLGPLPRIDMVKLTVSVSAATKASLDHYASLHSQLYGENVDAIALIPHMLQAFIERDCGFKALRTKSPGVLR